MSDSPNISQVAALIGDPARAQILVALMRGQALTVSELAAEAGVGLPTASSHLARLQAGGLVTPRKQGRHKYFQLASDGAVGVIEALTSFAGGVTGPKHAPGPRDPALRQARICYDHLAGERGVQLYDSLIAREYLTLGAQGLTLSAAGWDFAADFGITPDSLAGTRPPHCRECLDWSARRSHLGGRIGRAYLGAIEARGWAHRVTGTRIVAFTSEGQRAFARAFPAP